jgi:hypothetical protein
VASPAAAADPRSNHMPLRASYVTTIRHLEWQAQGFSLSVRAGALERLAQLGEEAPACLRRVGEDRWGDVLVGGTRDGAAGCDTALPHAERERQAKPRCG